jgi:hypothetical protein
MLSLPAVPSTVAEFLSGEGSGSGDEGGGTDGGAEGGADGGGAVAAGASSIPNDEAKSFRGSSDSTADTHVDAAADARGVGRAFMCLLQARSESLMNGTTRNEEVTSFLQLFD